MIERPDVYFLVDGENIDMTLTQILGVKPQSDDRPRWDRLLVALGEITQGAIKGVFFLIYRDPMQNSFIMSLRIAGYQVVLLHPEAGGRKVIDEAIKKTLIYIKDNTPVSHPVLLGSHDADFCSAMFALAEQQRKLAVVGFSEWMSGAYYRAGIQTIDMELDCHAFLKPLNRPSPMTIDTFDPSLVIRPGVPR